MNKIKNITIPALALMAVVVAGTGTAFTMTSANSGAGINTASPEVQYNFSDERPLILEDMDYFFEDIGSELSADDAKEVKSLINELSKITDEDDFFDKLDEVYDLVDPVFNDMWEDFDFDEERPLILEDITALVTEFESELTDTQKSEVQFIISELNHLTDEGDFFDKLTDIDNILIPIFEDQWGDYNFSDERPLILEDMDYFFEDIGSELSADDAKEVKSLINELSKITDEDDFFDKLDEVYDLVDPVFNDMWEDFDFDEERPLIVEETKSFIGDMETELTTNEIKKVKSLISELSKITDENTFFNKLDEVYDLVDAGIVFIEMPEEDFADEVWDSRFRTFEIDSQANPIE